MANALQEWSSTVANLVESLGAGVVRVESARAHPASGIVWGGEWVLTPAHALAEQDEAEVGLPDGTAVRGEVAGLDPATDLALLRVEAKDLRAPDFTELDGVKVGQVALTLARPGRTVRARLGIVSAFGESWRTHGGGRIERYLETDHDLPRGYSGGLLVSAEGRALGMVTGGLLRGTTIGIPAVTLRRVAAALRTRGTKQRGYLGVNTYPVPLDESAAHTAGQERGLIVLTVQPGSPAEQGGLRQGDVLLSLLGARTEHLHDLIEALNNAAAGKDAPADIVRAGERRTLQVKIGERGAA
jgi:S1-C subfamily serine protease